MRQRALYTGLLALLLVSIVFIGCSSGRALPESQRLVGQARINMRSGNTYMTYEEFDLALERYLEVVDEKPEYIEALKRIGDIYFFFAERTPAEAAEYYEKSFEFYRRAIRANEDVQRVGNFPEFNEMIEDADLKYRAAWARLFNMGQQKVADNQFEEALEMFYELSELTPDSTNIYIMIATIYQSQDQDDRAAEYFERIARIDETDTVSRRNLAAYHFTNQNFEQAIRWYEEVSRIEPNDADVYYMKGIVYISMEGREEDALAAFERAYELDSDFVDAAINAGNIAFNLQDFEKTIYYFKRAVELEPENEEIILYLLYALNYEQDYELMLDYGKMLYEVNNQSIEAVQFVILAASNLGKPDIQRQYLEILNRLEQN